MKRLHNTFTPLFGEIIMSTKIFNGLILRDYTFDQALPLLIKAREQFLVLMKERVSKVFARKLAFRKDLLLNFSTLDRASHRNIYMLLMDEVFQAEKRYWVRSVAIPPGMPPWRLCLFLMNMIYWRFITPNPWKATTRHCWALDSRIFPTRIPRTIYRKGFLLRNGRGVSGDGMRCWVAPAFLVKWASPIRLFLGTTLAWQRWIVI